MADEASSTFGQRVATYQEPSLTKEHSGQWSDAIPQLNANNSLRWKEVEKAAPWVIQEKL